LQRSRLELFFFLFVEEEGGETRNLRELPEAVSNEETRNTRKREKKIFEQRMGIESQNP